MPSIGDLCKGIVVETRTQSWTGPYFYSDKEHTGIDYYNGPLLNELSRVFIIGIAAGITRMALAVIHCVGHLFMAVVTLSKGHSFHVAKGGCEFLRGLIEAIPFAGRKFANLYFEHGEWWIIKIYNPDDPDSLDRYADHWKGLRKNRPTAYVQA
ncbi:MAG: hypothetical protein KR126chlam3_01707 [Chlamydiae bacterium]|nr:hypothetical protein [Chlamydiota bacterium]